MEKKVLAIIFGGNSSEHEVSRVSTYSILNNINKEKYEINILGITKQGEWFLYTGDIENIKNGSWEQDLANKKRCFITPDSGISGICVLESDEYKTLKIDVAIPVLHGKNGEDGTVPGLLQLAKIPFVGCDLLSSAACMDKITTNIVLSKCGIKKAKFTFIFEYDLQNAPEKCLDYIEEELESFPMFVKPSNAGSSVGVSKVKNRHELLEALLKAAKEDSRILVEETIIGQEVECAILGNEEAIASPVGEIVAANDFYDYEAKYESDSKLYIPAKIEPEIAAKIREIALKSYKIMGCSGLSRVDFFVQKETNQIFLNEINTFPGFTSISMYPKLFEHAKISYSELIEHLINFALERSFRNVK